MNETDRDSYRRRYSKRLAEFGYDPKTLGWNSGKQQERFQVLTSFVPSHACRSVLDVGCGFGDLYGFLREKGYSGRYLGVDFVPQLIEEGRRIYPDAELLSCDISEFAGNATFDLVVASGIFNARLDHEENWMHITETLKKMFSLATMAIAADFLTAYADFNRDDLYYTSPEQVLTFAKGLTRRVALRHDYMPFEFAVCLYKDDRIAEGARFYRLEGDHGK